MEFLETVGDWFNGIIVWFERLFRKLFGSANERRIRQMGFVRNPDGSSRIAPGSMLERVNSNGITKLSGTTFGTATTRHHRPLWSWSEMVAQSTPLHSPQNLDTCMYLTGTLESRCIPSSRSRNCQAPYQEK